MANFLCIHRPSSETVSASIQTLKPLLGCIWLLTKQSFTVSKMGKVGKPGERLLVVFLKLSIDFTELNAPEIFGRVLVSVNSSKNSK